MKANEKKMILILLIVLAIAIIMFVVNKNKKENNNENTVEENKVVEEFVEVLEDGTRLNTSKKLSEMKKINGLEFGNIQLTNQNNQSVLLADVKNTTSTATDVILVDVILYDKEGNELGTVGGIISPLQPGGTTQFNASMGIDYANAYDFKVVVK